mmetsp:Transcript_20868/g.43330  ORF Transcript_20868/g.43330 Transcript_20868/m.43330 type:complete len:205 (+) Transcript_20868:604-1218(+)
MDDDLDVVVLDAVEPVGLDDLQALVHHCRRVHGDLGPHVPVGVRGGLLTQKLGVRRLHVFNGHVAEGAPAAREDDLLHAALRHALQALEDCRVLRVHRQHADTILLKHGSDDGPACDERLLVGKGDVLAGLHRFDGRDEPRAAHDACDDRLALLMACHGALAVNAAKKHWGVVWDAQRCNARLELLKLRLVARDHGRPELAHLL